MFRTPPTTPVNPQHLRRHHDSIFLHYLPKLKHSLHHRLKLDTGAPSGYLDPYPQVFSEKNPYLDLQRSFPTVHLDPQVFYLQVTGQQILKVPAGIQ